MIISVQALVVAVLVSASEDYTYQGETKDSIQDHLIWQMELTPFTETDQTIAVAIIEAMWMKRVI